MYDVSATRSYEVCFGSQVLTSATSTYSTRAEPEQPAEIRFELGRGAVKLPPGDSDDAPTRRPEAPVPDAIFLEAVVRVVSRATVELND